MPTEPFEMTIQGAMCDGLVLTFLAGYAVPFAAISEIHPAWGMWPWEAGRPFQGLEAI